MNNQDVPPLPIVDGSIYNIQSATSTSHATPPDIEMTFAGLKQLKEKMESLHVPEVTLLIPRSTYEASVSYHVPNPEIEVNGERLRALEGAEVRIVESDILPKDAIIKIDQSKIPLVDMEMTLPPTSLDVEFFDKPSWNRMIRDTRPKLTITCNPIILGMALYESAKRRDQMRRRRAALRRRANRALKLALDGRLETRKAKRRAVRAIARDARCRGINNTVGEAVAMALGLRGPKRVGGFTISASIDRRTR